MTLKASINDSAPSELLHSPVHGQDTPKTPSLQPSSRTGEAPSWATSTEFDAEFLIHRCPLGAVQPQGEKRPFSVEICLWDEVGVSDGQVLVNHGQVLINVGGCLFTPPELNELASIVNRACQTLAESNL